jgi:predicted O-methyltransferase YrrM
MAATTTPTTGTSGRRFARFIEHQQNRASVLLKCLRHPRLAYSRLQTEFLSPDAIYVEQSQWIHGALQRVPLNQILPHARDYDLKLIRPLDRTWGTSITPDELCCLLAIAKSVQAKNILEIGTFDGNTTVNLAENTGGTVITVDLPPDRQDVDGIPNMTDRMQLGRQIRGHSCEAKIRQIFGDSTRLDWKALGAPFDLIFIDGAHHYEFVASLADKGAIVWHDYAIFRDVSRVVDETAAFAAELDVSAIEGTRLAVGFRRK